MNNDDLISRQAAIDAINHICPIDIDCDGTLLDRVDVRCVLSDLPSAQPEIEPKTGRWFGTVCSACGESTSFYYDCDYCPNCGAKMKE